MAVTEGAEALAAVSDNPGLLAWAKADNTSSPPGRCYGKYPGPYGDNVQTIATSNTKVGAGLGVYDVPVIPGRMLRARFKFWCFGGFNSNIEWYFLHMVAENGGAYAINAETRLAPAGINAPSPMGEGLYIVPPGVTKIHYGIDVNMSSGQGTLYRYNGSAAFGHSYFSLEDLGPAY